MKELIEAVQAGDIDKVKALVEKARDDSGLDIVNEIDVGNLGITPLMLASMHASHFEIARYLLESGAKVNLKSKNDRTALMFACSGGAKATAELLLAKGAQVFVGTSLGVSALSIAVESGDIDLLKLIYESSVHESSGARALNLISSAFLTASLREKKDAMQYLSDKGVDVSSSFLEAVKYGSLDIIKFLVNDLGVNVNLRDHYRFTPLMIAIDNGRDDVIEFLLEKKADINVKDISVRSILMHAVLSGKLELVKFFIEKGCDVNAVDYYRNTPLMLAIHQNSIEIVKCLIAHGAKTDNIDLVIRRFPLTGEMRKLIEGTLSLDYIMTKSQYGVFAEDDQNINDQFDAEYVTIFAQRAINRLTKTTLSTDIISFEKYLDRYKDRIDTEIIDNIKNAIVIYLAADILYGNSKYTFINPPILSEAMIDNIADILTMKFNQYNVRLPNFKKTLEILADKITWPEELVNKITNIVDVFRGTVELFQQSHRNYISTDDDSDNDWPDAEDWITPVADLHSDSDVVIITKNEIVSRVRTFSMTDSEDSSVKESSYLQEFKLMHIEETVILGDDSV